MKPWQEELNFILILINKKTIKEKWMDLLKNYLVFQGFWFLWKSMLLQNSIQLLTIQNYLLSFLTLYGSHSITNYKII